MKRNICFVVHNFSEYGGVGFVVKNLANSFSENDNVHLISIVDDGKADAYVLNESVRIQKLVGGQARLRQQQLRSFRKLISYFKKYKIEIAIILGHYTGFMVAPVRPFVKTKLIFCDHGALMNQWGDKKNRIMRFVSAKLCNHTVALTERTKNDYIERFHLKRNKVSCIYNWIDESEYDSNLYNIESKRIISAGRFGYEKGFERLVDIMKPVITKHNDWHLDIYGDGEMQDEVVARIKKNCLENNVHLLGKVDDLRHRYGDYSFYVLPSFREGLPIVLLEAKMNLLPIIAFDVLTGPSEIVRNHIDGLLVSENDENAFSDAINYLIESPKLRRKMSDESKGNIGKFDKTNIIKEWNELIDKYVQ